MYRSKLECLSLSVTLKLRLLFAENARGAYPSGAPIVGLHFKGSWPWPQKYYSNEVTDIKKHSSLLLHGIKYGRKCFIVQALKSGLYHKIYYGCNKFQSIVSWRFCYCKSLFSGFDKHISLLCYGINGTLHLNVIQTEAYRGQLWKGKRNKFFNGKIMPFLIFFLL